ncbi:hypothetical protein BRADI_1g42510v3 [Brachypodium distachyon]|uniref:Uncharacterized protein n=1 Tax=Brachypodium distachyon TaxID=15368 RepID=I1GYP2_BRADI|nr:hypothetical protein BRADI_1g42510v3 [Brachypodium distachyon]
MAVRLDPLELGKVIGEVVDRFVPTMVLSVRFGTKVLTNGCEIKPSVAVAAPAVQIGGGVGDLFTLVMIDPDAPSPSEPSMREWLHWLVVNIPGGADPSQGKEVVPYMSPRPALGIHRYVLVVFQQRAPAPAVAPGEEAPGVRAGFRTREFAKEHGLGLPVAAMYFNAQKEPASRRRRY